MRKVRTSSLDPIRSMVAFMEADEPMSKPQNDLFTDVPYDGDLVGPTATVHDLLKAKGRRGASAYAARTAPEIGRRAPTDILAGSRGVSGATAN